MYVPNLTSFVIQPSSTIHANNIFPTIFILLRSFYCFHTENVLNFKKRTTKIPLVFSLKYWLFSIHFNFIILIISNNYDDIDICDKLFVPTIFYHSISINLWDIHVMILLNCSVFKRFFFKSPLKVIRK